MLHEFKPGTLDATKCLICKRAADMHECDICGREVSVQVKYGNMLMCAECTEKEEKLYQESQRPENIASRVVAVNEPAAKLNEVLKAARSVDDGIQVRTDLFNAATVAITELKTSIDNDVEITNKPYALAEELKRRFEHFRNVVFELNQQIVEAGNQQKAIQVYLNQLANTLRSEEREKLKISDLNYQPQAVKPAKPRAISTTGTKRKSGKLDKAELRKYAAELGVAEFTLQMLVVSKGITVEEAAKMLKATLDASKAN